MNVDFAVCLRLAAATGARRGEIVAIQWPDFRGARLTIRRSLVESEGQLFERRTKTGTKGHRTIAVDAETMRAIDAFRARQQAAAEEHELPDPVYVFSHDAGSRRRVPTTCRSPTAACPSGSSGCTACATTTPPSCSPPASR